MGLGRSSLSVGAWAVARQGTEVSYTTNSNEDEVEFVFRGDPPLELILSKSVLERCVELFPEALRKLDR